MPNRMAGTSAFKHISRSSTHSQTTKRHGVTCKNKKFQMFEFLSGSFWGVMQCHWVSLPDVSIKVPRSRTVKCTNENSCSLWVPQLCKMKAVRSSETSDFINLAIPTHIPAESNHQKQRCHHHHHHHMSVMELGHLLTRSGLTYLEVSSEVCHDSFCQFGE